MYLNRTFSTIIVFITVFIGGCGSQPTRPESQSAMAEPAEQLEIKAGAAEGEPTHDPSVQRNFDNALRAMKSGNMKKAKKLLLALIDKAPALSGPYANMGIIYALEGDDVAAEKAFTTALTIHPENALAYNQLGILYRSTGRFGDALEAYQKSLAISPDYANAHLNLAILYDLYMDNPAKAVEHYQCYLQLVPEEDKQVALWLAEVKQRLDNEAVQLSGVNQ